MVVGGQNRELIYLAIEGSKLPPRPREKSVCDRAGGVWKLVVRAAKELAAMTAPGMPRRLRGRCATGANRPPAVYREELKASIIVFYMTLRHAVQ